MSISKSHVSHPGTLLKIQIPGPKCSEHLMQLSWSRAWEFAPTGFGCWGPIEHSLRNHAGWFTGFSRENLPHGDIWYSNRGMAAVNKCQHLASPAVPVAPLSMRALDKR